MMRNKKITIAFVLLVAFLILIGMWWDVSAICPDPMPEGMVACEDWEESSPPSVDWPTFGGPVWPDSNGSIETSNYGWQPEGSGVFNGTFLTNKIVFSGNRSLNKTKLVGEKSSGQMFYYLYGNHTSLYVSMRLYFPQHNQSWNHNHFVRMNAAAMSLVGIDWVYDEIYPISMSEPTLILTQEPDGEFIVDEKIIGQSGNATMIEQLYSGGKHYLALVQLDGTFIDGETVTGEISGATGVVDYLYLGGERRGRNSLNVTEHWNEWIHMEWFVDVVNDSTSLWFNGEKYVDNYRMDFNEETLWRLNLVHYSNNAEIEQTVLFDDIIVSEVYRGPGSCINNDEITYSCVCGGEADPDNSSNVYRTGYCCGGVWQIESCPSYHKVDLNDDGVINMKELISFIARWKAGDGVSKAEVLDAREIWFIGGRY